MAIQGWNDHTYYNLTKNKPFIYKKKKKEKKRKKKKTLFSGGGNLPSIVKHFSNQGN